MRIDILALILAIVSACIAIVSLMSFVTYSSEVAALKIKIQKQDEKMEQWHIRMIERVEKALDVVQGCTIDNKHVLEHSRKVIEQNKQICDNFFKLTELISELTKQNEELRSSCEKLLLLYSNEQENNENEKEVSA